MPLPIFYAPLAARTRRFVKRPRGTRADYEQQLPRIDGINFPPSPDTRRGDRRKSRLKHVECGRRASPTDIAAESDRAADGGAEGDEWINERMQIMHPGAS